MEGVGLAAKRKRDLAFWQAWHGAAMDGMTRPDLKRIWGTYFRDDRSRANDPKGVLAFMRALKDQGLPISIKKLN